MFKCVELVGDTTDWKMIKAKLYLKTPEKKREEKKKERNKREEREGKKSKQNQTNTPYVNK